MEGITGFGDEGVDESPKPVAKGEQPSAGPDLDGIRP
jgi:hypothetical protein